MEAIYYEGQWYDKNPALTGPMDHAFWMSSVVFDGARAFRGLAPDLDMHCQRLLVSANALGLDPELDAKQVEALCIEGVRRFPKESELYIRPMFFATEGFVLPEPGSTKFTLAVYEMEMPPYEGLKVCLSSFRRPGRDQAPTDAKAPCLYPNTGRALREAAAKGYDNALILDPNGNVAELSTANIWIAKDGVALTPMTTGTFLDGITRRRIIQLLRQDGTEVVEHTIRLEEVMEADEIFTTGNYAKVQPIIRLDERDLQPGPMAQRARDLYFEYAEGCSVF